MDESGKLNRGCNKHHRSPTARFHFLFLLFRYSVSAANNRYQYPFPATARPCFEAVTACKRDPPVYLSPLWSITNLDPFLEGNGNSYLFCFFSSFDISSFLSRIRPLFPISFKSRLNRIEPCSKKAWIRISAEFWGKKLDSRSKIGISIDGDNLISVSFPDPLWQVSKLFPSKNWQ